MISLSTTYGCLIRSYGSLEFFVRNELVFNVASSDSPQVKLNKINYELDHKRPHGSSTRLACLVCKTVRTLSPSPKGGTHHRFNLCLGGQRESLTRFLQIFHGCLVIERGSVSVENEPVKPEGGSEAKLESCELVLAMRQLGEVCTYSTLAHMLRYRSPPEPCSTCFSRSSSRVLSMAVH